MYDFISGKLAYKENTYAVVENNGVGFEIRISPQTAAAMPAPPTNCMLYTYLNVREDALTLYGFLSRDERNFFLMLLSVSGVGPSTALMILATLSVQEISEAIGKENFKTIQLVKGIGLKTAQRIVLELKDKIRKQTWTSVLDTQNVSHFSLASQEALEALVKLGLPKALAEKSLKSVIKTHGEDLPVSEMIRLALKSS